MLSKIQSNERNEQSAHVVLSTTTSRHHSEHSIIRIHWSR